MPEQTSPGKTQGLAQWPGDITCCLVQEAVESDAISRGFGCIQRLSPAWEEANASDAGSSLHEGIPPNSRRTPLRPRLACNMSFSVSTPCTSSLLGFWVCSAMCGCTRRTCLLVLTRGWLSTTTAVRPDWQSLPQASASESLWRHEVVSRSSTTSETR